MSAQGEELVGVTEAARRLAALGLRIDKSTLSRQISKGLIPNHGTGRRPLVRVGEVQRSRLANIDPSMQRGEHSTLHGDAPPAAEPDPAPDAADEPALDFEADPPRQHGDPDRLSFNTARTAREAYQAKNAQLDYEQRVGKLLDRREVESAMFTLGTQLREGLQRLADTMPATLAGQTDPAVIRTALETAHAKLLEAMIDEFARKFRPLGGDDAAA